MSLLILETGRERRIRGYEEFYMQILLADKRSRIRFALRLLIEQATGHTIVDEVADVESLVSKIQETMPDLVLLEWELSEEDSGKLIASIKEEYPQMKVVVLSSQSEWRRSALIAGADDFVSKADSPERLLVMLNKFECPEGLPEEAR